MLGSLVSAHALARAAAPVITSVLTHGGPSVAAPTDEPTAVAALTWVGTPGIAASWSPILRPPGLMVTAQGVFCHGSPKVSFSDASGSPRTCELADLLIVIDDCTGRAIQDRRAVLVQAKLFSPARTISTAGTAAYQLDLLMRWPSFRFTSVAYNPAPRDFAGAGQPGAVHETGRYGGIDIAPLPAVWEHLIPSSAMAAGGGTDLAIFLSGMAVGSPDAGREAAPGGSDDWSRTIDELLSVTALQSVTLTASLGLGSRPRGISAATLTAPPPRTAPAAVGSPKQAPLVRDGRPPALAPPPHETGPDGGISIVRIAINRTPEG